MASFERFAELPKELRDQIWSFAGRDDRPGVHIFGQYDKTKENTGERQFLRYNDRISKSWAAPSWRRYYENFNEDRSDENISTYLIDGGLWTACHESRLIMERRFEQSNRKRDDEDTCPRHDKTKEVFKKATTGCFDSTPLHPVTVFPHRDLFVLQCNDLKNVNWSLLGLEASMAFDAEGFNGVMHVALEYDPKWWYETRPQSRSLCMSDDVWEIMEGAFEMWPNVRKLWFIDHSLRRKKEAPAFKEKADNGYEINAFYASDRRFLEVNCNSWVSMEKEWEYVKPVEDKSIDGFSSSLHFIEALQSDLDDKSHPTSDNYFEPYCDIGLLGWDTI
ncbi:hypothetical protein FOPG_09289 [Fusarium oxysporum f. sp. conglutinans race 2 54008]|uniref:2EXR domain-containing protein n=2 Tax=Fusarium oxysporum f. sp. conglutinans TaxID=100902 RepID=F9F475_FUSOF|nr:hypothetical protein FOXB_01200 [Fusarium oxysporum f. sp. conglutinans Fo5176]EXL75770.1 hypothetical protein FOPG_09289 [Fusarium oxysporum f. sp. conglutinans race 2 54008]KAG7000537.1 hypothetical protein FocnCong_v012318 [Fusarium oxysporum f. sp. conglutinans]KAI8406047.1 hypothetical protein FOFC_13514 [Fusarium oxysporum]